MTDETKPQPWYQQAGAPDGASEPGVRHTLQFIAKLIDEYALDPIVRSWALNALREAGSPRDARERIRALGEARPRGLRSPVLTEWFVSPRMALKRPEVPIDVAEQAALVGAAMRSIGEQVAVRPVADERGRIVSVCVEPVEG